MRHIISLQSLGKRILIWLSEPGIHGLRERVWQQDGVVVFLYAGAIFFLIFLRLLEPRQPERPFPAPAA